MTDLAADGVPLLHLDHQPENNMVTAAQKLNRTVIVKKHKKEIDAMIAKQ